MDFHGLRVRYIHGDHGTEHDNKLVNDFLTDLKHRKRYVTRTWSEPYGPTQNSPVERSWSTLLATIRTLLTDMNLSDEWWEDAREGTEGVVLDHDVHASFLSVTAGRFAAGASVLDGKAEAFPHHCLP